MNYYERYCGDYMRDTAHLGLAEHGAYTVLLDIYYATERPLPASYDDLYRICRAMNRDEQTAVRKVADQFFPINPADGLRHQDRCDREIARAQPRIEAARANGKSGGRKPKRNPVGSKPEPGGNPPDNPPGIPLGSPDGTRPGEAFPHTPNTITSKAEPSSGVVVEGQVEPIDLWCQYRQEKGYPLGPTERALAIARLADHDDPRAAVEQAIHRSSKYIDPPEKYRQKKPETPAEKRAKVADEMYGNLIRKREQTDAPRDITGESERVA